MKTSPSQTINSNRWHCLSCARDDESDDAKSLCLFISLSLSLSHSFYLVASSLFVSCFALYIFLLFSLSVAIHLSLCFTPKCARVIPQCFVFPWKIIIEPGGSLSWSRSHAILTPRVECVAVSLHKVWLLPGRRLWMLSTHDQNLGPTFPADGQSVFLSTLSPRSRRHQMAKTTHHFAGSFEVLNF